MISYLSDDYVVALSIALVQFAILASLLYQIRQVSKNSSDNEKINAKPLMNNSSKVTQLEFDKQDHVKPQINTISVNNLNDDEVKILRYLINKGDEAYQAEIARELGLPKSTVSRIIRRLYEGGLVIIRRNGRITYIQVVDPDYVNDLLSRHSA